MSWQDKLSQPDMPVEVMKQKAALRALAEVRSGMKLGLGTGSTVRYFIDGLGAQVADGLEIACVPTSETVRAQALSLGIPLTDLDALGRLDLTVDGADEMDAALQLIKGGRGALLREKIVAAASDALIIIADDTKLVDRLGAFALPVEVNMFAHQTSKQALARALADTGHAGEIMLRGGDDPFISDGGHYIYDCALGQIGDGAMLGDALLRVPGVVEHGLFLGYATGAVVAGRDGLREIGSL